VTKNASENYNLFDVEEETGPDNKDYEYYNTNNIDQDTDADLFNVTILEQVEVISDKTGDALYKILHMLNVMTANSLTSSEDIDYLTEKLVELKLYACNKSTVRHIVQLYFPILAERGDIDTCGRLSVKASNIVYKYIHFLTEYCNILIM